VYFLLKYLPKNHLSYAIGRLAALPVYKRFRVRLYTAYARCFGVNLSEVEKDLEDYPSLSSFFVRELKAGCRPIGQGLVSPVDGLVSELGSISQGRLLQVKGREYFLHELLQDRTLAKRFEGGQYATIYLAPGDYHHIHAPAAGRIGNATYIEGKLWPVNAWSVANIDGVFSQNERMVCLLEGTDFGLIAVVMVGATNVGSVRLTFAPQRGNSFSRLLSRGRGVKQLVVSPALSVSAGEKIGSFFLGSTVVLCLEKGKAQIDSSLKGRTVRFGEELCRIGSMELEQSCSSSL
jgi:phosphatidylserine decarboxylase